MRDFANNCVVVPLWDPIDHGTGNTATVSEIVDMQGCNALMAIFSYGSIADTDATSTLLVEDSNSSDMSGAAAVDDAYLIGTEANGAPIFSDDNTVFKIGYTGPKRYVRFTLTPAANTGALLTSAVAVKYRNNSLPQTTQHTGV
jgi:hypothetical protein